jgi:hypothetical protein
MLWRQIDHTRASPEHRETISQAIPPISGAPSRGHCIASASFSDGVKTRVEREATGAEKRISYSEISSATAHDMGVTERWRLIGADPLRFRSWYNWDQSRRAKTKAVVIDTGGFFRRTVTPGDADAFISAISDHTTAMAQQAPDRARLSSSTGRSHRQTKVCNTTYIVA